MPVPNLGGIVYVAKQSAKGTPASTASFAHALTGGKPIDVAAENDSLGVAVSSRVPLGDYPKARTPQVEVQSYAHAKGVGIWLLGLLGQDVVTGTGPYTHTMTPAASTPYLTVWGARLSGGDKQQAQDVRVTELELSWDGTDPLALSVSGIGCGATLGSANPGTPTVDETASTGVFTPVGGTVKVDVVGSTPLQFVAKAGSVKLGNGATPVPQANLLTPADVLPTVLEGEVSLTILPDNLDFWREALTGSGSGTSLPTSFVGYGALELNFNEVGGNSTLKVACNRVRIAVEMPEVNAGGEPLEVELSGTLYGATAGDFVTVTLVNQQASY